MIMVLGVVIIRNILTIRNAIASNLEKNIITINYDKVLQDYIIKNYQKNDSFCYLFNLYIHFS